MPVSHRPIKSNQLEAIKNSQFLRKLIENAWAILIVLVLVAAFAYNIYIQFAHHIF